MKKLFNEFENYFNEKSVFNEHSSDLSLHFLNKDNIKIFKNKFEHLTSSSDIVSALTSALSLRDEKTSHHVKRVTIYCDLICDSLKLSKADRKEIVIAGLLHDVGKIGVSDRVLLKPSSLNEEEWEEMRAHTEWGYEIVRSFPDLQNVATLLLHHHEQFDGTGYPDRLKHKEIPFGSRVIAVADAFDAMTSDRPYRKAYSFSEAQKLVNQKIGSQFDPKAVEAFNACFKEILKINQRDDLIEGCSSDIPLVAFDTQWHGLMT